jgi:hypothetical protein
LGLTEKQKKVGREKGGERERGVRERERGREKERQGERGGEKGRERQTDREKERETELNTFLLPQGIFLNSLQINFIISISFSSLSNRVK